MYIERLGFDPDTVQKLSFVEMLKRIGPGIILTFYATLVQTGGPEWGPFFQGVTHWQFPKSSIHHSLAFISTHSSPC